MRELVLIQPGRMLEGLTEREAGQARANLAGEKQCVGHFAEQETQGERSAPSKNPERQS